jgi:hypothetical protein
VLTGFRHAVGNDPGPQFTEVDGPAWTGSGALVDGVAGGGQGDSGAHGAGGAAADAVPGVAAALIASAPPSSTTRLTTSAHPRCGRRRGPARPVVLAEAGENVCQCSPGSARPAAGGSSARGGLTTGTISARGRAGLVADIG